MKTKITHIISTAAFAMLAATANAQPLPPSTPFGNPVPIANLAYLLPFAMILFGIYKLRKRKK